MPKLSRSAFFTLGFAFIAVVWHGMFLPFSRSCYTDGILQIDCFRYGATYWPPLYAVMTRLFSWLPGVGLESGGRIVSFLAGAIAIFPLSALARRLFGLRAAFWAMAVWIATPMTLRWSLQVMTDMPMTALWTASLAGLALAVEQFLPGLFPPATPPVRSDPRRGMEWLLLATIAAALATLTRYQGILLLPLTLVVAAYLARIARSIQSAGGADESANTHRSLWLTQLIWLIVPLWVLRGGLAPLQNHFAQIDQRAGTQGPFFTLINVYWSNFESFLCLSPYFISMGLFGFFVYGLLRVNWSTARLRWFGFAALYLMLAVLVAQSVFSSFQERYLLPLIPLVSLFAGHGLATWERRLEKHGARFWILGAPAFLLAIVFSGFMAMSQGSPFLDIKLAAQFVGSMKIPPTGRILTNEVYNEKAPEAYKVSFWSGLDPSRIIYIGSSSLRPGDVILLSSYCEGSIEGYNRRLQDLLRNPAIEKQYEATGTSMPLLPDLMTEPHIVYSNMPERPLGLNQNAVAWNFRYGRQSFQTVVLRVRTDQFDAILDTPVPVNPQTNPELLKKLEDVQGKIRQLNDAQK